MISLSPVDAIIKPLDVQDFDVLEGQRPYIFEVLAGGAGGTIDQTGEYTAPAVAGSDVIRVTDAGGQTADAIIIIADYEFFPSRAAVRRGLTKNFSAFGGTEPYAYKVLKGPGSIDGTTGVFTADDTSGLCVIQVTDFIGLKKNATILIGTPLELFCDIIQQELGLDDGRVYLWDQKVNSPNDYGLFVAVAAMTPRAFGNKMDYVDVNGALYEEQSINFMTTLSVDVISRDNSARDRLEEVVMALKSTYSQQQQEANSFFVSTLPSAIVNLSEIDGAAIPYRFNFSVSIQYATKKTKQVPFYGSFSTPTIEVNA